MITSYSPSVCRQDADSHTHYNIVLIVAASRPQTVQGDRALLTKLAQKFNVRTAGGVVLAIQEKRALGVDLAQFGIDYMTKETIPIYQVCHKTEDDSPSVDWEENLFVTAQEVAPPPPGNPKVARIRHS